MTEKDQIFHFGNDLENLVDRYRKEYDISLASVIGTLQIQAHTLIRQAAESDDD